MAMTSTERSRLWRLRHPGADAAKTKRYRDTPKGQENEIKKSRKRRMLKLGRYSADYVPEHGTKNGYDWHRRGAKEEPCEPCREAMKAYWVLERKKKFRPGGKRPKQYTARHIPYTHKEVLEMYGTNCHICKKPIDLNAPRGVGKKVGWEYGLHFDHVIPLSKGGEDTIDNVKPAHAICNMRKSDNL